MSQQKLKKLSPGDTIGLVALSSAVSPESIAKARAAAAARGFKVREPFDSSANYGKTIHLFSAESIKVRVQALHDLFIDPNVAAVFAARGAYGCVELLPEIDFKLLAKNPKPIIGFSDVTAVLLAAYRLAGLTTIHGPTFLSAFSAEDKTAQHSTDFLLSLLTGAKDLYQQLSIQPLSPGKLKAQGKLLAGNLTVIQSLIGTPWQPDFRDRILFFEETGEKPYRLHRMLLQLRQTGVLDGLAGVVVGDLKDCNQPAGKGPSAMEAVLAALKELDLPTWQADWFGHGAKNLALPIGAEVNLQDQRIAVTC